MCILRDDSLHTPHSTAYSCVLLLVSEISKKFTPMENFLGLNGKLRVAGCLVARTRLTLFICKAYSWIATSRSELAVYGSAAHSSEAMSPSGKFFNTMKGSY